MHAIFVDNARFPLLFTFFDWHRYTERRKTLLCGLLVRWELEGQREQRVVVVRLDPDVESDPREKGVGRFQTGGGDKDFEVSRRSVDSG